MFETNDKSKDKVAINRGLFIYVSSFSLDIQHIDTLFTALTSPNIKYLHQVSELDS